jgi:1,2-dihydroxy-3-keto-5-methylthiopentene dioxygenase
MPTLHLVHLRGGPPQEVAQRAVAVRLARAGVGLERVEAVAGLREDADLDVVLDACAPFVARSLAALPDPVTLDVAGIEPDDPDRAEARARYCFAHTHSAPELRLLLAGSGLYGLHLGEELLLVELAPGDALWVPAGLPHWFDMGARPRLRALRFLGDEAAREAHPTPVDWARRCPPHRCAGRG